MKFIIGTVLLCVAIGYDAYHENQLIQTIQTLNDGLEHIISLGTNPKFSIDNNGKLIHFHGLLMEKNDTVITSESTNNRPYVWDLEFGIIAKGVKLKRRVEMLQWIETKHEIKSNSYTQDNDISTPTEYSYTYDMQWRQEKINSQYFDNSWYHDKNPLHWFYESQIFRAKNVKIGDYKIPNALLDQIRQRQYLSLQAKELQIMQNIFNDRFGDEWKLNANAQNRPDLIMPTAKSEYLPYEPSGEAKLYFLIGPKSSEDKFKVGDLRISFEVIPAVAATVCAGQSDENENQGELIPYINERTGLTIFILQEGSARTAPEVFEQFQTDKENDIWMIRGFSAILCFIGNLILLSGESGHSNNIPVPFKAVSLSVLLVAMMMTVRWSVFSVAHAIKYFSIVLIAGITSIGLLSKQVIKHD